LEAPTVRGIGENHVTNHGAITVAPSG